MVRKLIAVWLLMISVAAAQSPQTVEVRAGRGAGSGVVCGGTPGGELRVVMSVAHVTGPVGNTVYVHPDPDGRWRYEGTVVGADTKSDAAMILIRGHRGPITDIPNARIWLGDLYEGQKVRTEGFAHFGYHEAVGGIDHQIGSKLWWHVGSHSGMSGGPSYLVDQESPAFVTTTTATDGERSVGPYRGFFKRWVPTCASADYEYGLTDQGEVEVTPKRDGLIEDAIAQRPKVDPSLTET